MNVLKTLPTKIDHLKDCSQDQIQEAIFSWSEEVIICTCYKRHPQQALPESRSPSQRSTKRSHDPSISHPSSYPPNLHLRSLSVDVSATAAAIALCRNDLVVVRAKVEAIASPGVEVGLHVDGAADALVLADRPVLTEGPGTVDRRLVGPGGDVDVVVAAVGGDAAKVLSARAGVVGSEVLDLRFVSSRIFGNMACRILTT